MKPPGLRADDSVPLLSSRGVFANRAHHELLRRIGSFAIVGGLGSRMEEGLGERAAPRDDPDPDPAYRSEVVWCEDDEFESEFWDACSRSGDKGTKSDEGCRAVRRGVSLDCGG